MAGRNSHQRAVERAVNARMAERVAETVLQRIGAGPVPPEAKTTGQKLLDFFEHGWVIAVVGTVGTLVQFFYTPVLVVCGFVILIAFHRVGVVRGKKAWVQTPAYLIVFMITTLALYGVDRAVKNHLTHIPSAREIASALIAMVPQLGQRPQSTVSTDANNPPAVAIFYDCQLFSVPISIPPQSEIHLLPLNRKRMLSQNWGLSDIRNQTDKQMQWPSKERMELAKRQQEMGTFGYKCDFSNLSRVDFLNVAVPLSLAFDNGAGGTNAVRYTPILSPLGAGSHFVFYVVNDCLPSVSASFPKTVDLSVPGESGRRNIPLNRPNRSPLEQVMMFFPTKNQWVGETPCEQG